MSRKQTMHSLKLNIGMKRFFFIRFHIIQQNTKKFVFLVKMFLSTLLDITSTPKCFKLKFGSTWNKEKRIVPHHSKKRIR